MCAIVHFQYKMFLCEALRKLIRQIYIDVRCCLTREVVSQLCLWRAAHKNVLKMYIGAHFFMGRISFTSAVIWARHCDRLGSAFRKLRIILYACILNWNSKIFIPTFTFRRILKQEFKRKWVPLYSLLLRKFQK